MPGLRAQVVAFFFPADRTLSTGIFFFFKQETAYEFGTGDWSSDVCSSDLEARAAKVRESRAELSSA